MVHEVEVEQPLTVPPDRVWDALTRADELAAWFWPWDPRVRLDARPDTAYEITAQHPQAGRLAVEGVVERVEAPELLVLTWRFAGEAGPPSRVEIRVQSTGGGSVATVRHVEIPDAPTAANYRAAWSDLLVRLAQHVSRSSLGVGGNRLPDV